MRTRVLIRFGLLLAVGATAACKDDAEPRREGVVTEACRFGAEAELDEFCDQDERWRDLCRQYRNYDAALEAAAADCAATGFPVALGDCDLRVIDRSLDEEGTTFYFDNDDGDLVGIRVARKDRVDCPESAGRERSVRVTTAGRAADDCSVCHVCGARVEGRAVCEGEAAAPYIAECIAATESAATACSECACNACYPWSLSNLEATALQFQECVIDHCPICTEPDDEDGGTQDPTREDAGT